MTWISPKYRADLNYRREVIAQRTHLFGRVYYPVRPLCRKVLEQRWADKSDWAEVKVTKIAAHITFGLERPGSVGGVRALVGEAEPSDHDNKVR